MQLNSYLIKFIHTTLLHRRIPLFKSCEYVTFSDLLCSVAKELKVGPLMGKVNIENKHL
jgi:hypothetical protein